MITRAIEGIVIFISTGTKFIQISKSLSYDSIGMQKIVVNPKMPQGDNTNIGKYLCIVISS